MPRYTTRQREALLDYLSRHPDQPLTVREIAAGVEPDGVSLSAVYRNLAELEAGAQTAVHAHAHGAHPREQRREERSCDDEQGEYHRGQTDEHEQAAVPPSRPGGAHAGDGTPHRFEDPRRQHAHEADDHREEAAAVQLAVLVAEDALRQGSVHVPGDVARPPVQVAQHDEPAEDGNEAEQRQQHELAEPARGVLDILPSGVEVTGLHSDLLFLSVWHPL